MLKRILIFCLSALLVGMASLNAQSLDEGKALYENEEYDRAEAAFKSYLGTAPKDADDALYWIGMCYYKRDAYAPAKDYFFQGLEESRKSALNFAGVGLIQMIEQKYSSAADSLARALEISKGKDAEVDYAVAAAYLKGGSAEIQDAKKILYGRRDQDPEDPRTYIMLGEYYQTQDVLELAIEELEKAIVKKPDYVRAYVGLAELYYEQGKETGQGEDFEKAFDNANKAIEMKPDFAPAYRTRAEIYLLMKNFDKATADMEKYVSLTEGDLRAELRYASFLFLTENYQGAVDQLASIDTTTQLKRRLLGMSYQKLDRLEEAKAIMDEYFEKTKKEEYIIWQDYMVYGDIFRAMGDLDKAKEAYVNMIMKNSEQSVYFEDLAEEYLAEAKGFLAKAKEMRSQASAAQKQATEYFNAANACAENGDQACKDEMEAKMNESVEQGKVFLAEREKLQEQAVPSYANEAYFRQLVVDYQPAESLQNYYKLAKAQYNGRLYADAKPTFNKVLELKPDYAPPYNYLMQIANKMEAEDPESMSWFVREPAEAAVETFGGKPVGELKKGEKRLLIISYEILANYNFNPTGGETPESYNCEAAQPYVDKVLAIDPAYESIKSLADYCAQQR